MLSIAADGFAQQLTSDRLIQIFVAANKKPYLIQESFLKQASEYFFHAIEFEDWGVDQVGKLHFPDDDEQAFKVLMYYIVNKKLPAYDRKWEEADTQIWLIESWILADKYLMRDLQDLVMMEMLFCLTEEVGEWEAIRFAFKKAPKGSKLRKLFLEEALFRAYDGDTDAKDFKEKHAKALDEAVLGIPGACYEILKTQRLSRDRNPYSGRLEDQGTTEPYLFGSYAENSPLRSYWDSWAAGSDATRLDPGETEDSTETESSSETENPWEGEY